MAGLEIDVPADWADAARRLAEGRPRRVLVLGPPDAGKSTLCRFLLHEAAAAGRAVALVDADVGQKTVGPPACVTLGRPGEAEAVELAGLAFVGTTDPVRGWRHLLAGLGHLTAEARADLLLVNTGGLLAGPGRRLKAAKIGALRPDLLVALGSDPGLEALLDDHAGLQVLRLAPSPRARRKTAAQRRAERQAAFRDYFAGAATWTAAMSELPMEGAPDPDALPPRRLLVGLIGDDGRDLALGLVADADPAARTLTLLAAAPRERVRGLRRGTLGLDETFREVRPEPSAGAWHAG